MQLHDTMTCPHQLNPAGGLAGWRLCAMLLITLWLHGCQTPQLVDPVTVTPSATPHVSKAKTITPPKALSSASADSASTPDASSAATTGSGSAGQQHNRSSLESDTQGQPDSKNQHQQLASELRLQSQALIENAQSLLDANQTASPMTDLSREVAADTGTRASIAADTIRAAADTLDLAAVAVVNADSTAARAVASTHLAEARLALIIAAQNLDQARADKDPQPALALAERTLASATRLVVLATGLLDASVSDIAATETLPPLASSATNAATHALDEALNASITQFDGQLSVSRQQLLETAAPLPSAALVIQQSPSVTNALTQTIGLGQRGSLEPLTATFSAPQDDDIIAKQLWEAASAETDIERQEKLWEAYRRYRSGQ